MLECPKHGGAFDCTPFCEICEGNQEFTPKPLTELDRMGRLVLSLPLTAILELARHLEKDFGLNHRLSDAKTEALRELKNELNKIIINRES